MLLTINNLFSKNIINITIILISLLIRSIICLFYFNNRKKYIHDKKLYYKFGDFIPITTLITYTATGSYLCIFSCLYEYIYNYNLPTFLFSITWVTLFVTNLAYYVLIYPSNYLDKNPNSNLNNILDHGPLIILFSYKILLEDRLVFVINEQYYSFYFALSWLIFIWLPWYYFTNDPIYKLLGDNISNKNKIKTILKITFLCILSFYFGQYLEYLIK